MPTEDPLAPYKAKRDFTKTPEPKGVAVKASHHRYLIQKHAASHLHYDFRLELDGTLKSWAVPKGPSLDPHDKRLAMQVEDHPVEYGSFEGIIPKGEYGGGTVMLWDEGTWEPIGDPNAGLAKGKLVFQLHGQRLKGEWTLVKTASRDRRGNSWLLIKHRDEEVSEGDNARFLEQNATSVTSGRTMDEIAAAADEVWSGSQDSKAKPSAGKPVGKKPPGKAERGLEIPDFTPPQLATLSTSLPKGSDWVHEIKFDGYRMIAHLHQGRVKIFSRNGKDWTSKIPSIAEQLGKFAVNTAIFDGELVAAGDNGKTDFMALKDALGRGDASRLQYYVFDLLFLNGEDLTPLPLLDRKERLATLVEENAVSGKSQSIIYSQHFQAGNSGFLQNICSLHLEGVVSKRSDAPYHSGRGKVWLKTKCQQRQEFVIGGFTLPSNGTSGIGALLLGYYEDGRLRYAGRVGTGFTQAMSKQMRSRLDKLRQTENPYVSVSTEGRRGAIWVKPQLVCEVEFTEWTPDSSLRHPSFKGLRDEKSPREIVREKAVSPKVVARDVEKEIKNAPATQKKKRAIAASRTTPTKSSTRVAVEKHSVDVGGIKISHPERLIYPGTTITKQQLAEYYFAISTHILPHIVNRPLSMVRCPEGSGEPCFFQRHVELGKSPHLHEVAVTVKGQSRDYLYIKQVEGLIALVQWGVIELHPWQCAVDNVEKPDRIIFDLDPDPSVGLEQLIEGAFVVRQRLSELGLQSFLKTTGGKGLHVVAPLTPHYGFPTVKAFARAIADSMVQSSPSKYVAKMSKAARAGKIFVDYLRNDVTSTAVAPFSARARPGATVSTPLAWGELTANLRLTAFTIETVPKRLKNLENDPWLDFIKVKQAISAAHLKALKIDPV